MKRLGGLVLCALWCLAVFAQSEADFITEVTEDGGGMNILRYTGSAAAVRIPAAIGGMPVRVIGDFAFAGGPGLVTVTVSPVEGRKWGDGVFAGCPLSGTSRAALEAAEYR
jgi:hypothetical protein